MMHHDACSMQGAGIGILRIRHQALAEWTAHVCLTPLCQACTVRQVESGTVSSFRGHKWSQYFKGSGHPRASARHQERTQKRQPLAASLLAFKGTQIILQHHWIWIISNHVQKANLPKHNDSNPSGTQYPAFQFE